MNKEVSEIIVGEVSHKQDKIDSLYLRMAFIWAENSYAIRRQVGCLIVKNNSIISDGYNGTPSGFPNVCEYAVDPDDEGQSYCTSDNWDDILACHLKGYKLISYPMVLHAESNAITKLAKLGNSSEGATIYVTDEPCIECAKLIIQAGIKRVVFSREYRTHEGLELLKSAKIIIKQINVKENGD